MGDIKAKIVVIVGVIIAIVIIFNFIGGSTTNLTDAAYAVTDSNNCSLRSDSTGAADIYNRSNSMCINSTGDAIATALQYDLPLNTMFGASGVIFIVLMAAILVAVVIMVMRHIRKR